MKLENCELDIAGVVAASMVRTEPTPGWVAARDAGVLPPADLQLRRFSVLPEAAPAPRRERRRAKRVRPKEPVHVRLSWGPPLPILDISAVGLLVELTRLVKPGTRCEVELERSGQTVRLRGEVVRSSVASGTGSDTGLQYRTAVQFLATPPALFTLVPELSEEA